jgi:hypothetical protein
VINSEISVEPPRELPPSPRTPPPGVSLQDYHTRAPHRAVEVDGSITVNFPEMFAELRPCNPSLSICVAEPPVYQLYQHQQQDSRASPVDWVEIPEKLQPPEFRVHRCHHRGVERSGEGAAFELPFGFPEIVHHLDSTPQNVCNVTLLSLSRVAVNLKLRSIMLGSIYPTKPSSQFRKARVLSWHLSATSYRQIFTYT